MNQAERERLRYSHVRAIGDSNRCHRCSEFYPCPTIALLNQVDALTEALQETTNVLGHYKPMTPTWWIADAFNAVKKARAALNAVDAPKGDD